VSIYIAECKKAMSSVSPCLCKCFFSSYLSVKCDRSEAGKGIPVFEVESD
jgi:hypothetical protein